MFCITSASLLYPKHKHIDNVTQFHYASLSQSFFRQRQARQKSWVDEKYFQKISSDSSLFQQSHVGAAPTLGAPNRKARRAAQLFM